jgi:DNA-binding MarR family transcriptional regulator
MTRARSRTSTSILAVSVSSSFEQDWPGANADATEIVLNLGWLSSRMLAAGEPVARSHGLPSLAAFNVLEILRARGPLTPSAIADRMIVRRQTMTGILDTLERRGLIERTPDPDDRRQVQALITPSGAKCSIAARSELHVLEQRWVETLTKSERWELLRLVAKMQALAPQVADA